MPPWIHANKRRKTTPETACDPPAQQHQNEDSDSNTEEEEEEQEQGSSSSQAAARSITQSCVMNNLLNRIRGDASAARSRDASSPPNSNRATESRATEVQVSPVAQQPVSDASCWIEFLCHFIVNLLLFHCLFNINRQCNLQDLL